MAVGATPRHILSLIFGQGFLTVAVGLAVGLSSALAALRFLRRVLSGLETPHPASVWIAAGLVKGTAAIACWIHARRATSHDPVPAIRQALPAQGRPVCRAHRT